MNKKAIKYLKDNSIFVNNKFPIDGNQTQVEKYVNSLLVIPSLEDLLEGFHDFMINSLYGVYSGKKYPVCQHNASINLAGEEWCHKCGWANNDNNCYYCYVTGYKCKH